MTLISSLSLCETLDKISRESFTRPLGRGVRTTVGVCFFLLYLWMGNIQTQTVVVGDDQPAAPQAPEASPPTQPLALSPPLPPPPTPTLDSLPVEVLHTICQSDALSIVSLSGLCVASKSFNRILGGEDFDDVFRAHLHAQLSRLLPRLSTASKTMLEDLIDLVGQVVRNAKATKGGCRTACAMLRHNLCWLCDSQYPSGCYFPLSRRGLCATCIDGGPAFAERWRRQQNTRELKARRRRDESTKRRLLQGLGAALPRELGGGEEVAEDDGAGESVRPRLDLLFDAQRHGGSSTALLRAADGAAASLLVCYPQVVPSEHGHDHGHRASADSKVRPPTDPVAAIVARYTERGDATEPCFGAFIDSPWDGRGVATFFGGARCFLWRLEASSAEAAVFGASDENRVHASRHHGLGFGGQLGAFGLSLDDDLTGGSSHPSVTYGAASVLHTPSSAASRRFLCKNVQLWSVRAPFDATTASRRHRAKAPWEDEPEGCLEPGENKLMLEFIGMDKEVAMLRRFT